MYTKEKKKKAWNCKPRFVFISQRPRRLGILVSKPPLINSENLPQIPVPKSTA